MEGRTYPKLRTQVDRAPEADAFAAMDETDVNQPASPTDPNRHLMPPPHDLVATGVPNLELFRFLDRQLQPRSYFEIGTESSASLKTFSCDAVCVDPAFALQGNVLAGRGATHFFQMSSDDFLGRHDLRRLLPGGPDICFLDGMHRCEFLLREFMNTERSCHRKSLIFLHDCLPANERMTRRLSEVGDESEGAWRFAWTGDVWKMIPLLANRRPDLRLLILDCAPTGLVAISGLDPASTALADAYPSVMEELRTLHLDHYTLARLWAEVPVLSSQSLLAHPEDVTLFLDIH